LRDALPPGRLPRVAVFVRGTSMAMVTYLYYLMTAYVSLLLIYNLIRSKRWERDVLYVLVLIPFLLRLFRLK
jgi:ABC-type spermidine/putrescine transport system permease subunit I